ncbi:Yip1 family protein [Paenibacillus sp. MMS20-IR301]|uniref:Yip1 family protein n=1 Tax=Paenibacillus sp. MMS20-IR301 TaxID=2895946 RepID=UPI0028EAF51B|nr:Yip1 family protein [Paenibacillus sp. MMS20-IR301]WNS43432.1 Yip1 family protein [Paenibacillus sp. MMS20-IR301]
MNTLRMIHQVVAHPYEFYHDIQGKQRIAWFQAILIILLTFAARMISILITGYAFQTREPHEISMFHEFIWLVVPWLTWCVSNWGVSTILDGEGKFKEIFVGSAFALAPYMLFIIPVTLLTLVLSLDEASTFNLLQKFVVVWVAWLILLKVKILHDFEIRKVIFITVISLVGIAIIWFVGILLFGISNQFVSFIVDLLKELRLRA